jgi:hypothetical protein
LICDNRAEDHDQPRHDSGLIGLAQFAVPQRYEDRMRGLVLERE